MERHPRRHRRGSADPQEDAGRTPRIRWVIDLGSLEGHPPIRRKHSRKGTPGSAGRIFNPLEGRQEGRRKGTRKGTWDPLDGRRKDTRRPGRKGAGRSLGRWVQRAQSYYANSGRPLERKPERKPEAHWKDVGRAM